MRKYQLFDALESLPDKFVKWGFGAYLFSKILKMILIIPFFFIMAFWLIFYDEYEDYKKRQSELSKEKNRLE